MVTRYDRMVAGLERGQSREDAESLARSMHFPPDWDRYFTETMTVEAVYRYATQHYNYHRAS